MNNRYNNIQLLKDNLDRFCELIGNDAEFQKILIRLKEPSYLWSDDLFILGNNKHKKVNE